MTAISIGEMIGDISAGQAAFVASAATVCIAALNLFKTGAAHREAKAANAAVNGNAPEFPRLYEMVMKHGEALDALKNVGCEIDLWKIQNNERWVEVIEELKAIRSEHPSHTEQIKALRRDLKILQQR